MPGPLASDQPHPAASRPFPWLAVLLAVGLGGPPLVLLLACGGCFVYTGGKFQEASERRREFADRLADEERNRPQPSDALQAERLELIRGLKTDGILAQMPLHGGDASTMHVDPEAWESMTAEQRRRVCAAVCGFYQELPAGWQDPRPSGTYTVRVMDARAGGRLATYFSSGILAAGGAAIRVD